MQASKISPVPTDHEAVAIAAAVEALWPKPAAAESTIRAIAPAWRFSGRWWRRDLHGAAERPWT